MSRISLCMIVGNEAAHILTCLNSFAPAFDELSLVRACGNRAADDTAATAADWCHQNGRGFVFSEYKNEASAADWDHVDSFAAARNASFKHATGDWLMWCDADDVAVGIDGVRACVDETDADLLLFPYDVPGTNKAPMRERLISRKLWEAGRRWVFAVHENFACQPADKRALFDAPVWRHAPVAEKPVSHGRNLRILSNQLRDVGSQLFYVHQEHFYAKSKAKAREFGELALAMPNLHHSFRFEILMNLGRLAESPALSLPYLGHAFAENPHLREPLAALVAANLELGNHERAADCVRVMLAIPEPPPHRRPWSFEAKWYGWAGLDLAERISRLNGREPERREDVRISLVHATRGRAQAAWECRERWLGMAANPAQVEHIMAVDSDDTASMELAKQFRHVVVEPGSCVRAWNAAAGMAIGQVLVQLSDDWMPCYGWDDAILREIGDTSRETVLAVSDGNRTDSLLCMAIVTRARLEQQEGGTLFSPEYLSVYSDNEFSHRAWRDGVVIDARERVKFRHIHPYFDKSVPMDATYGASNAAERYADGKATFERRNPDAA
jgi:glycosyltransferase involved in cell wall biosynthesis